MDLCVTGMKQQEQEEAYEVKERVRNNKSNVKMMKSGLRGLQGPRPAPLKICKDSHTIAVAQRRPPVIIYTGSPEVIHTQPRDFSKLVQRLTGSTTSSLHKSHRSEMKAHSNYNAAVFQGPRSSHSQVVLEPSTSSVNQDHQEDISSDNLLRQILSQIGLHSPPVNLLNPSFSPNSFPIPLSPSSWVLKSSDISPGYTFPLEHSPLFSYSAADASFDHISPPSHVRPSTRSNTDESPNPFNRLD